MKKNLFYSILAASAVMMATGCSQDEIAVNPSSGGESTVSFAVQAPDGIATRTYGDGLTANQLSYAVYDKEGNLITALGTPGTGDHKTFENHVTSVELKLVKGNTYTVVFWAAPETDSPYQLDWENKQMTISPMHANSELGDAFYATSTLQVTGDSQQSVTLTRPFAQLNIGTNDYEAAEKAGFAPDVTQVTVSGMPTQMSLWDGSVSGSNDVTYTYASIPQDEEAFPVRGNKYLAMNYVLVGNDKVTTDVTFDYGKQGTSANPGAQDEHQRTFASVPVQRNYRTNIYGSLLTNTTDFNVIIDPQFQQPDYKVYLQGAASLQDYVANTPASELARTNLSVDLQEGTLKNENAAQKNIVTVNCKSIAISNGTVDATGLNLKAEEGVTLKDVTLTGEFPKANSNAGISVNTPGDVVIDGVHFTGSNTGRYNAIEINLQSAGEPAKNVTVKNCSFEGLSNNCILVFGMQEEGVVNVENCQFELADGASAVRISNRTNANHFTVKATNCNYNYHEWSDALSKWLGFFLFEDYTSTAAELQAGRKQFAGLYVDCKNVTYNGTVVRGLHSGQANESQFACMCYDKANPNSITDTTHFPTFNFQ